MRRFASVGALAGTLLIALPAAAQISNDPAFDDPLHGFCWGTTPACLDNNTNTPTGTPSPDFGFWASSGPLTGDYRIAILVPDNAVPTSGGNPDPSALSGLITVTGVLPVIAAIPAVLVSTTEWSGGALDDYTGNVPGDPNDNITAYLPATQGLDPGAGGYFVYEADLGSQTVTANIAIPTPELQMNAELPKGAYIVGFLEAGNTQHPWIATTNSGSILETGGNSPPVICTDCGGQQIAVPEPAGSSVMVMGLLTLGLALRRRRMAGNV